jgi:hypothetical protein
MKSVREQCDLGGVVSDAQAQIVIEPEMNAMEQMIPITPPEIMAAYIGFTRAYHLWFHAAHNLTKGTGFAGDHTNLYGMIYIGVQDSIDRVIEKAVGVFNDESLACPIRITSDASLVLEGWNSPADQGASAIADAALEYTEQLVNLDEKVAETLNEMGALTYGLDNLLAELADVHEGYVYLLRQRVKN